jgi:transcriptional regulator with GAF, ATPase, and Fis domain
VTGSPTPDDAITALVDRLLESVRGERARLFLCDSQGLRPLLARSAREQAPPGGDRKAYELAMRVVLEGRSISLVDERSERAEVRTMLGSSWDFRLVVAMAAPLRRGDRILGVLYVDAMAWNREFKDTDLRVLEEMAERVADRLAEDEAGA